MKKKKISLRKIILLLMILGCLTSAVAIILTSYSSLQLMNQNNIEDNMKMNLYQFTKESDEACYKLLRVLNQMSADGYGWKRCGQVSDTGGALRSVCQ